MWKFDGETANDTSGSGANGSLQGSASYSTDVPTGQNNAPTITITDPQNNTNFAAGSNVVIDASASDSDGSITQVEFFQGSTLLGTDSTAPYTFVWNNVAAGSYAISARATDDLGATTTTTPRTITVNQAGGDRSVLLNGTSSYVDVPYNANLNITGALTMEAWVKTSSTSYQQVLERGDWFNNQMSYDLQLGEGKARMDIMQSNGSYAACIGSTVLSTGVWHHIAGVYDGSQMRLYLDGVLDASATATMAPGNNSTGLRIGKSSFLYYPYYFNGRIDEVRISNAAIYTSNFTPSAHLTATSNTKGLWKFDGETTNDASASGANGSLQGGATYSTDVPTGSGGGAQLPIAVPNGPYNGQRAQSISFSSSGSFDPDGTITAYHWNFGDGTSSNTANPAHAYQTSGLFTATLTVTDNSGLLSSSTTSVSINGASEARLDPANAIGGGGENPLSRNFNWWLPLVSLPGRAGLDLKLSLSYNSLVWTKNGNTISFDDDYGFPGPGFRLGFPSIQGVYLNSQTSKWSYLLIGPEGGHTELRQVSTNSPLYESADSSHLLLDTTQLSSGDPSMLLRTTDGTQLTYKPKGVAYECTEIKERNGNYLTINYNYSGHIANIHDTLDRVITFNYDTNSLLTSITQQWKRQPPNQTEVITHTWASFSYSDLTVQTNFDISLSVVGPPNNSTIKVLTRVTLDDNSTTSANNSHFDFDYTPFAQVWKISDYAADNHLLNYRAYRLPKSALWTDAPAQNECPRFTERRDWGQWANGDTDGVAATSEEIVTTYSNSAAASWVMLDGVQHAGVMVQVTAPNGTFDKIYFADTVAGTTKGWLRGLPELVESYDVNVIDPQRKVFTSWEQDTETLAYPLNPRVKETNISDSSGNRKRTTITYQSFTPPSGSAYKLPRDVFEYAADPTMVLRSARTDYVDGDSTINTPYLSRRIFGLAKEKTVYEGNVTSGGTLASRVGFSYDESGSIQGTDAPVQHDNTNYGASFIGGRGNLSTVKRYDVNNGQFTALTAKYNTAGAIVSSKDALHPETKIDYADSFSFSVSQTTLAYPTKITDPDGYYSTSQYNFDFGAVTSRKSPPPNYTGDPNSQPAGPEGQWLYDDLGRLERTKNLVNNAYTRFVYASNAIRTETYATLVDSQGEAKSFKITDGFGQVIATASDHPATPSTNARFDATRISYDIMGRVFKTSTPVETSASGDDPSQWQLVEGDAGSNWIYTQQIYDWKGRPKLTTNPDGTTRQTSYDGCGCAGGEVVTLTDEGTDIGTPGNPIIKKRQQKIYHDVLGRVTKREIMNWDGSGPNGTSPNNSVYATTVNTYNARDQITNVRHWSGASDGGGPYQDTAFSYDGQGRLSMKHVPEQNSGTNTVFTYNNDDTVNTVTDGRGAVTSYLYNGRNQVTSVAHALSGQTINVSYVYDAAGNRTSMSHTIAGAAQDSANYSYDQLSRLTSETRHINALGSNAPNFGDFTMSYGYTLSGELQSLTDAFNSVTNFNYDTVGRTATVSGTYGGTNYTYANNVSYRAWGAVKSASFGNGGTETVTYNSRLQPVQFRLANGSINWMRDDYSYYDDGRLRQLTDLDDVGGQPSQVTFHYMSRQYHYDQAGRVASVGGVPNNWSLPPPFSGSYGYDAFNNMSSRLGTYALNSQASDSATYTNNRRVQTGWTYDPDGRLLTSSDSSDPAGSSTRTWSYNAAGEKISVAETKSGTTTTNTLAYDGDGALLYESVSGGAADYLLRSKALGNILLTKLDGSGNKNTTYVPTNGLARPYQVKDVGGNTLILWMHDDASGVQENGAAYDPFGNRVQNVQPPSGGPPPYVPTYGATWGGASWSSFANANNLSQGCINASNSPADCNGVSIQGMNADFWNNLPGVYNDMQVAEGRYVTQVFKPADAPPAPGAEAAEAHQDGGGGQPAHEAEQATGGLTVGEDGTLEDDSSTLGSGSSQDSTGTYHAWMNISIGSSLVPASTLASFVPVGLGPQNTGTEQPLTPAQADTVYNVKELALLTLTLSKECRDYIGAGAFDKLQELWNTKQLKYFNGTRFSSSEPDDTIAAARGGRWSNSLTRGGPYSWDSTDRIVLGYLFFQPSVGGKTVDFDLSTESAMALVMLHELKHVLSQVGHPNPDPGNLPNSSKIWEQNIYDKCFKNK